MPSHDLPRPARLLAVGAALAVTLLLTACANDPVATYLAEVKAAATASGQESPTDQQALLVGAAVCAAGDTGQAPNQEILGVIREHCDIFPLTDSQRVQYALPGPGAEPATSTAPGVGLSPRGAIPKAVGERAGVKAADGGSDTLGFTVTKIEVDPQCQATDVYREDAVPVPGGHFVALYMDIETGPGYRALGGTAVQAAEYIGSDGYSVESGSNSWPSYLCAGDDRRLSSTMQPGSKYRGVLMLNVPSVPGTVVLSANGDGRWEYAIPAK